MNDNKEISELKEEHKTFLATAASMTSSSLIFAARTVESLRLTLMVMGPKRDGMSSLRK